MTLQEQIDEFAEALAHLRDVLIIEFRIDRLLDWLTEKLNG